MLVQYMITQYRHNLSRPYINSDANVILHIIHDLATATPMCSLIASSNG